jgi:HNH endonuclease/AP2 domain
MSKTLSQQRLKELLHYDPESGEFTRITQVSSNAFVGSQAGWRELSGYFRIMIDRKKYMSHRLAWLYVYGSFPKRLIDHIDGNPSNNKISNLRECTASENGRNQKMSCKNTSGVNGISLDTKKAGQIYWKASWKNLQGTRSSKSFSVNKHGFEIAKELARLYREKILKELENLGISYSERHGK